MRVLVLGGDGYLGWPLAMKLSHSGHDVSIADSYLRRKLTRSTNNEPLVEFPDLGERKQKWFHYTGINLNSYIGNLRDWGFISKVFQQTSPDCVVHLAEQPSAPFSMIDRGKCIVTSTNNIVSTLNVIFAIQKTNPRIHLVKLGTMGEYGTPNIDIEEGWIEINHNGRKDRMLFPKKPGSFYHCSKVADSVYLEFACRSWGLKVTDLNQGIVYGIDTEETILDDELLTSFHYDSIFGTVLNRFMTSAVKKRPLLVYGKGSQTRGFLNIKDTIKCVEIATMNPPKNGQFRVFNQFTEQFSVAELANKVVNVSKKMNIKANIEYIDNPRVEDAEHYYNAKHSDLQDLGLKPVLLDDVILEKMMEKIIYHKHKINSSLFEPKVKWKQK